ncbi:hypothetical protein KUL42_32450 [Alteromonas sp. KUL42]|uniref:LamG domain-containing protein n=1 Tax=Alteromonas sp. KUL42 TaxID=2480797 RepID=UPI001036DBA5|nr:LamG domain-containing protein [Alteromonas sp. KUL42]TAP33265.1 LamG domain-containing protein [Alteromonas sp. KUL42]GEA08484.1 hypothetical protein KUL42_32450 [Alteromonas sp. KUL42]
MEPQIIDLSGTYTVTGSDETGMFLQNPELVNSNWNLIDGNFPSNQTPFKNVDITVDPEQQNVNLDGTYIVVNVSEGAIFLDNPSAVNPDWDNLTTYDNEETGYISPKIVTTGNKIVGWFILNDPNITDIYFNFVALNGLYKDDGKKQIPFDVEVAVTVQEVDEFGNAIGIAEIHDIIIDGSDLTKSTRAKTLKVRPNFSGRCRVRAWRRTPSDLDFEGNVVDEVKWRDVYAMARIQDDNFGDVTTLQSLTYATNGALAIKERKLNLLATRKITTIINNAPSSVLSTSNRADDIILSLCLDNRIGNISTNQIDIENIKNTVKEVEDYFGTEKAIEFNYTFDSDNLSFEETIAMVASSIFCRAYRRGSVIKLTFERLTTDSLLLFNHRNKLPGSETRTVRFGNQSTNDGVELEYVDPLDDAVHTIRLPKGATVINPKKIETAGIRSYQQAYFHAWRAWNKIQHQNIAVEFEATQEADILVLSNRILVADNTRTGTQDGEVYSQNGLELELSQSVVFEVEKSYTIFLQHTDGTVESMPVSESTTSNYHVLLSRAPKQALSLDRSHYASALYQIVADDSSRELAFLLTEKSNNDNFTSRLTAINYEHKYYLNDALHFSLDIPVTNLASLATNGSASEPVTPIGPLVIINDATFGHCLNFNGSTAWLEVDANRLPASYTKTAWINTQKVTGSQGIICSDTGSGAAEAFRLAGNWLEVSHGWPTTEGNFLRTPYNGGVDVWNFVCATYDAATGTVKIFLNGVELASLVGVQQRDLTLDYLVGAFGGSGSNTFDGQIYDPQIYSRALTPQEIEIVFNSY